MTEQTKPFAAQVWETLSRVDVGDHIETISAGSYEIKYLSWSWAWSTLMGIYPESVFTFHQEKVLPNGTVECRVEVHIREGENSTTRQMFLPVMDRRNNSIENPTTRQISDARMRCLVKCLALFGLGLDLWTGSDMPVGTIEDPISPEQAEVISGLIVKAEPDMLRFLKWLGVDQVKEIPAGKFKQAVSELERAIKRKASS